MFIVLVLLLALLAGLASVVLMLGAVYVLWAWYMGELVAVAWAMGAAAALAWSLLGRHILLCLASGRRNTARGPNSIIRSAAWALDAARINGAAMKWRW